MKYIATFIAGIVLVVVTGACLPDNTPEPTKAPVSQPKQEDDPDWDCRFDGNQMCGVTIMGVDYVIQFEDGSPMSVDYK